MNTDKKDEALKLAQKWYDSGNEDPDEFTEMIKQVIALAESALERMAKNERELGLDYMVQPAQDKEPCGWRMKHNGEWAYSFTEDAWDFIRRVPKAQQQEQGRQIDQLIKERDHRDEIIDKLCDAVLGPDRYEWSSQYFFEDAVREVEERMAALEQPAQQQEPVQETSWQALPAGPIKVLHQCRAALIGPVADGLARRCAVAAIDAELARPAQQQEPVAYMNQNGVIHPTDYEWEGVGNILTPLYTSPPASKPWVGLTDEEAEDIWNCYCDEMGEASINDAPDIARAIEAKLKEKNV